MCPSYRHVLRFDPANNIHHIHLVSEPISVGRFYMMGTKLVSREFLEVDISEGNANGQVSPLLMPLAWQTDAYCAPYTNFRWYYPYRAASFPRKLYP